MVLNESLLFLSGARCFLCSLRWLSLISVPVLLCFSPLIFTDFVHTGFRLSQVVSFMDTGNLVLQSVLTGCPECDIRELLWVKPTQQKAKSEGNICRAGHACCQSHPPRSQNICVCLQGQKKDLFFLVFTNLNSLSLLCHCLFEGTLKLAGFCYCKHFHQWKLVL